jgi:hypothetical protein
MFICIIGFLLSSHGYALGVSFSFGILLVVLLYRDLGGLGGHVAFCLVFEGGLTAPNSLCGLQLRGCHRVGVSLRSCGDVCWGVLMECF